MEPVFTMIPGMADITILVPGHGVSICVITPGQDGALDMASEQDGSILALASVAATGVDTAGAAVAGGDRTYIVPLMYGIAPGPTVIMEITFIGIGTYTSTTTGRISTAAETG